MNAVEQIGICRKAEAEDRAQKLLNRLLEPITRSDVERIVNAVLVNRFFRLPRNLVLNTAISGASDSACGVLQFLRSLVRSALFLFRKWKTEKLWQREIVQNGEGIVCFLRKPGEHQNEKSYYYEPIVAPTLADPVFTGLN